jgi:hypothetical protein
MIIVLNITEQTLKIILMGHIIIFFRKIYNIMVDAQKALDEQGCQ